MLMLINLAKVFYDAPRLCSRNDAPLSSYDFIVQGIKNTVDHIIKGEDRKFDWIQGPGLANAISYVIDCRFNMDGAKPCGSKVGLIDEYHIWCFLMDPFNYEWRITYVIDGNIFAKNMIAHFIPVGGTRRTETIHSDFLAEFEVRISLAIALF
jgi:hypothetical protein